jgi:hypothetical protein
MATAAAAKSRVSSVHSPASISKKKLAANRRNAQRSTGPRTETGKRTSSTNARTHGLFCSDLVLEGEDERLMLSLRECVHRGLGIDGDDLIEVGFADDVVHARWKLRRLRAGESCLHDASVLDWRRDLHEELERLERDLPRRLFHDCRDEFDEAIMQGAADEQQARLRSLIDGPDPVAAATLAADLRRPTSGCERLSRYEQRLQQSISRALRELRLHRAELRAHGRVLRPYDGVSMIDEHADEQPDGRDEAPDVEAQNEPTADEVAASDATAGGCAPSSRGTGFQPVQATPRPEHGLETRAITAGENPQPEVSG